LEDALSASERRDRESQARIADLGSRLNVALAQKVQELARYRSDFFGRLREILGQRPGIRIVGDRFVFESEVLFETGQSSLNPQGRTELEKLASAKFRRKLPGFCVSMATPTSVRLSGAQIGISPHRAPLPWCSFSSHAACRRKDSWPPALANSSPSTRARMKRPIGATVVSS
jgi:hypothetical protein